MSWIEAIILGIVQGITEFLPISSSAHLIIVPWFANWNDPGLTFNVAIHMGTFLSVLLYFRWDLIAMASALFYGITSGKPLGDQMSRLGLVIAVGSIPAAVAGFLFEDWIDSFFHTDEGGTRSLVVIAIMLIVVGALMFWAERYFMRERGMDSISWKEGIVVGIAQALALIPGTSRSGSTMTAGLLLGLRRDVAARFSFLLGIPAVFGAGLFEGLQLLETGLARDQQIVFIAGIISAAIVGYISIAFLLRFLQTNSVIVFTLYRFGLGALMLVLIATGSL